MSQASSTVVEGQTGHENETPDANTELHQGESHDAHVAPSSGAAPILQDTDSGYQGSLIEDTTITTTVAPEPAQNTDNFSDFADDDDRSSYYSSLLSAATDYYWKDGRRYHGHKGGRYMLPNDEVELDREDMKHHEWLLITESRLHLSPIPTNPQRILDICTGTGIWAMQIAEVYPSATVIGTDISPVQPRWVPPNLTFEIDDIEEEWLYKSNAYDLVNCRFNFIAIKDWPAMLRQAMRVLKPGGYVELTELEIRPIATNKEAGEPTQLHRWLEYLSMGMQRQGFDFYVADKFKGMLEEAGFEAVVEKKFEVPWGAWCTDKRQRAIGFWHLEQLKQALQGIAHGLLGHGLGWPIDKIEVFLVDLRKELDDPNFHIMDHAYVVYGRKPGGAQTAGSSG